MLRMSRKCLQFSLRTAMVLTTLLAVTLAAFFQWTWKVELGGVIPALPTIVTAEVERDFLDAEVRNIGAPEGAARYSSVGETGFSHSRQLFTNETYRCAMCIPRATWSHQVSSVRLHWRDGSEKHGETRLYYYDGSLCGSESWYAGVLHGPYLRKYPNGRPLAEGAYLRGGKHGQWTVWDAAGIEIFRAEFDGGRRVGRWSQHYRPSPPPVVKDDSLLAQVENDMRSLLGEGFCETAIACDLAWTFDAAGNVLAMFRQ